MKLCFNNIFLPLSKSSHPTKQYQRIYLHFLVIHFYVGLKLRQWANLIVSFHRYLLEANPIQYRLHLKSHVFSIVAIDAITV